MDPNANADSLWWYALDGVQHGPVQEEALLDLRRRGQIGPRSLVWCEGMREWAPFSLTALHERVPDAPGIGGDEAFQLQDVTMHIILGIITCGLWGLVPLYQTGKAYATHSGLKDNFDGWFWGYVGAIIVAFTTGGILAPVTIVVGALLLKETLMHRRTLEARAAVATPLTDAQTHIVLWVMGQILSIFLVGIPVLIYQAVVYLQDHNRLCEARG